MILAVDYGSRFVGLAITDDSERLALRHSVIDQKKEKVLDVIVKIITKDKIKLILVGVPVSLSGEETDQTHVSLKFIEDLRDSLGESVEVMGVDETLTSVEAEKQLKWEGGNKDEAHAEAARIILQDYLRLVG
jgi:putative holliday junction resolvase